GHRRAREQAGRVGADQKKESTPLHLWLNGWRGSEKKSIDGRSIGCQGENSRSGRSRRQSFTGAKIELHQGIGKRSEGFNQRGQIRTAGERSAQSPCQPKPRGLHLSLVASGGGFGSL